MSQPAPPPALEILGTVLAITHARQPPGMSWEDWQAWRPWLAGPGAAWGWYVYDVELYTQDLAVAGADPGLIRMWARNTAKRIDAVGLREGRYDVFEARRLAGWSAVAQLLGYRDLWAINNPGLELGESYLVSERIDDAVRALAQRRGIRTWIIGEASPA